MATGSTSVNSLGTTRLPSHRHVALDGPTKTCDAMRFGSNLEIAKTRAIIEPGSIPHALHFL